MKNEAIIEIERAIAHENREFAEAVIATVLGQPDRLRGMLQGSPELVRAHSNSAHNATLLHYVSSNAIEDELQLNPLQIYNVIRASEGHERLEAVERAKGVAQVLFEAGAEVDALADAYGGGLAQTPLNWLVSSGHPSAAGVLGEMTDLFCKAGANLEGLENKSTPLVTALGFGHSDAAQILINHGCLIDNVLFAAAAGNLEKVKEFCPSNQPNGFDTSAFERIESNWFKPEKDAVAAGQLAFVFAAMCGQLEVIRWMHSIGVDMNAVPRGTFMTGGALHTAAMVGQESSVDLLIELGADPTIKEPRYESDALGWAREGGDVRIVQRVGQYLATFVRSRLGEDSEMVQVLRESVYSNDPVRVAETLESYPYSPEVLDGPWFHFDSPAVVQAKQNLEIVDLLIAAGANLAQKSLWWAGGFGVLDETEPGLANELMNRGAQLDMWSAASLNKVEELHALLQDNPKRLNARGPDGKTPLHCAGSIDVAQALIEAGADLNRKCWDHESTAVQYLVADRPDVARYLIEQGAEYDLMAAAALGEVSLANLRLDQKPNEIDSIVDRDWFPSRAADCIYSWKLGWYLTPHQVAAKFEHTDMLEFLMSSGDIESQFLNAALLNRREQISQIMEANPQIVGQLNDSQMSHLCHSARNNDSEKVLRLLELDFSTSCRGQHGATPLHWAAFHGNMVMLDALLNASPELEPRDFDFQSTPLGWAFHGASGGWFKDSGDYPGVTRRLLESGCQLEPNWKPTGIDAVDDVVADFR
ncbi:MAG: ankyrin repeat domain-containing protein [Aureliella sp.]